MNLRTYGKSLDRSKDRDPLAYVGRAPEPKPEPEPVVEVEYLSIDDACREVEVGVADCLADMPEVGECDAVHDIAHSIALLVSPADRREFLRRALA